MEIPLADLASEATAEAFFLLVQGAIRTQALVATAHLGIADALAAKTHDLRELASHTGADPTSLDRLMSYLESESIVSRRADGGFELLPLGQFLCREHPSSLRSFVLLWGEPWFWQALAGCTEAMSSGRSGMEMIHRTPLFRYLDQHSEARHAYSQAIESLEQHEIADDLLDVYSFERISCIIDIGGGTGSFIAAILRAWPKAHGVLLDLPTTEPDALRLLASRGVADRCRFQGGDFFQSIPIGGDVYILKWILVDWSDADLRCLLMKVRPTLAKGARLLVITGLRCHNDSLLARQTDLLTLLLPGGLRRDEADIITLFDECGLVHCTTAPVGRHWLMVFEYNTMFASKEV
jgi:SAM-dependent methyltransferase